MQKIKNGVVGCVLFVFIVGHNAAQGMKRKYEVDSALLFVVQGAYHHDNHVTFVNQMAIQHAARPIVHDEQRSAFKKFTSVNKPMVVESAIQSKIVTPIQPVIIPIVEVPVIELPIVKSAMQLKIVTFMEPVVTQTIEIPRIKRVLPSVIELPITEAPKIQPVIIPVIEVPEIEPPIIELVITQALNGVKRGGYRCTECRYSTPCKKWLRVHNRAHTMQKNPAIIVHSCSACDYLTNQTRQFNDHLAKHQDEEKNSYVNVFM